MNKKSLEKAIIAIVLGTLMVSAFFIRLHNFKNSDFRSIDEAVYHRMAIQINSDFKDYHTIPYGKELAASGRELPEYFFQPLFKHPPLFSFLAALSMRVFGNEMDKAGYVSLLFGVLMIPLTYFFSTLLFNRRVGILAAIFIWLDPPSIISSQKIWMDTTLAFLTVLSLYLFTRGLTLKKDYLFIVSGIVSGLAVNTKYPGLLATVVPFVYASLYHQDLLKNKNFLLGLIMPGIFLVPWALWNFSVYGVDFLSKQNALHDHVFNLTKELSLIHVLVIIGGLIVIGIIVWMSLRAKKYQFVDKSAMRKSGVFSNNTVIIAMILGFIGVLYQEVLHSFQIDFIPKTTWSAGKFANEPPTFYLGRLLEFSTVYFFAFAAFLLSYKENQERFVFLRISVIVLLGFFIVWRNYQSRYILASIPFLLIFAATFIDDIVERILSYKTFFMRMLGVISLLLVSFLIIAKYLFINIQLSFPNDLCYF